MTLLSHTRARLAGLNHCHLGESLFYNNGSFEIMIVMMMMIMVIIICLDYWLTLSFVNRC